MGILSWRGNVIDHGAQRHSNAVTLADPDGNPVTGAPGVGYDEGTDGSGLLGMLWNLLKTTRDTGIKLGTPAYDTTPVASGASITSDQNGVLPATPGLHLFGFTAMEDAGTPAQATFRIMHGSNVAGGSVIDLVSLSAAESTSDLYPDGIPVPNGLSVDWVSGSFQMVFRTKVMS